MDALNDRAEPVEEVIPFTERVQRGEWTLLVDRLFDCAWSRKLYHLLGGGTLAGLSLLLAPANFAIFCFCWLLIFGVVGKRVSTAALGLLLLALLTGNRTTIFGSALIFVAGDGVATLAGRAFGKMKLPWHPHKTVMGSASFFFAASVAMLLALPHLLDCPAPQMLLLALLPSLAGCLSEVLPFELIRDIRDGKPDDNLLILLSAGAVLNWLITGLPVGAIK